MRHKNAKESLKTFRGEVEKTSGRKIPVFGRKKQYSRDLKTPEYVTPNFEIP